MPSLEGAPKARRADTQLVECRSFENSPPPQPPSRTTPQRRVVLAILTFFALCYPSTQSAISTGSTELPAGADEKDGAPHSLRKLLQIAEPFLAGGQDAPKSRFPYACSLRIVGARLHICGGTLIAPEWVLTAAHCFTGEVSLGPTPLVYVGAHGIDDDEFAEVIMAAEVISHESFTDDVQDGFDIALVRLKEPSKKKMPAVLAQTGQRLSSGQKLTTAGWGRTERGLTPPVLQFAEKLQYVNTKDCRRQWPSLKDSMICAASFSQAACNGDSGGPLLIADSKRGRSIVDGNPKFDLLVGIVSYGPPGCGSEMPDVFTRVTDFLEWINEKMERSPRKEGASTTIQQVECANDCSEDLYFAAFNGELENVKELLKVDVDLTFKFKGFTALHAAAEGGHVGIVGILIKAGSEVDFLSDVDTTALYVASRKGHLDVVELLIEAGANVDAQDGQDVAPLYLAALNGHLDVVMALVKAGATLELKTAMGFTPLIIAAQAGEVEVVEYLLDAGADIDARTEQDLSPLDNAVQFGFVEVAKILIEAGASIDEASDDFPAPLHVAAIQNNFEMTKLLLESGAAVDLRGVGSTTPLHAAAIWGNGKLVQLFVDNEADLDARDILGRTPAFIAASRGNGEALKVLKEAGADFSIEDKQGNTVEDVICGCLEVNGKSVCPEGRCGKGEKERLETIILKR